MRILALASIAGLSGCGGAIAPTEHAETPESVNASIDVSTLPEGLVFPALRLFILVTGTSSRGLAVTTSALTI